MEEVTDPRAYAGGSQHSVARRNLMSRGMLPTEFVWRRSPPKGVSRRIATSLRKKSTKEDGIRRRRKKRYKDVVERHRTQDATASTTRRNRHLRLLIH